CRENVRANSAFSWHAGRHADRFVGGSGAGNQAHKVANPPVRLGRREDRTQPLLSIPINFAPLRSDRNFLRAGMLTPLPKNCNCEGSSHLSCAHLLQERSIVSQNAKKGPSRREVIHTAGGVAAASALAGVAVPFVHAAQSNTIQLALVGCGGRGTGAAGD